VSEQYFTSEPSAAHRRGSVHVLLPDLHLELATDSGVFSPRRLDPGTRLLSAMIKAETVPNLKYDAIIDSSEVGAIKPEARVYEIARERAGVPASEILLIDDSRVNLMAAEKLDWHVLWFDDSRPEESAARARATLEPAD